VSLLNFDRLWSERCFYTRLTRSGPSAQEALRAELTTAQRDRARIATEAESALQARRHGGVAPFLSL